MNPSQSTGGKLVLIDGNSLLYRAFFALPPFTNAEGQMTNAVYGFTSMLFKLIDEERPEMMAVAFDLPGPTFRHERFPEYKATRERMPDELAAQIELAREVLKGLRIPTYELQGYEADDVIGTLSARAEQAGAEVLVVTGDLDALQLVSERVSVMMTRRGISDTKIYDLPAVEERYGFGPEKLADFRALRGDVSDNIPGVPGVGEKTAGSLLEKFGSLEGVLAQVEEVKPARIAEALATHAELAATSKELAEIVRDLPLEYEPERLRLEPPDETALTETFRRLEFRSFLSRAASAKPTRPAEHRPVTKVSEASALAKRFARAGEIVVHPIAEEGPGMRAVLHGLCLLAEGETAVVSGEGKRLDRLLAALKPALEEPSTPKTGHDLKRLSLLLARRGVELQGLAFDTMIACYLVNPSRRSHDLASASYEHLGLTPPAELAMEAESDEAAAARETQNIAALRPRLEERLRELELWALFDEIEMPLVPVLAAMERYGVSVDTTVLKHLSERLARRIDELQADIHALAGEEFNLGSPKQLGRILFEKLGLPPDKTRRTKTGYSTDADVLAGLSEFEIVGKMLEYREVTKLQSTYVDALPRLVNPETNRIHTSLNQAVTATGRLSSSDPNLQNIPVRTELGMEIRRAFVPSEPEHVLLSADYSQIELRILAHITGDENLTAIFQRDEDLHRATAAEIFRVASAEVTEQMRAFAKMVNFGIPYGISEFRLAREMGVPVAEAQRYVARYFARFPKVRTYVEAMPDRARQAGYVVTLLGRRRYLPELRAPTPAVRQGAERMAINTPVQGSAADIIKLAMLRVEEELARRGLHARMILQVHDELLLGVPASEVEETGAAVAEAMSGAYRLKVPLKVDLKAGANWLEMADLHLE